MSKAIILLSGGLDSSTCLAYAHSKYDECYALSFDYGQKNNAELNAATKIAQHFQVIKHEIITVPIGKLVSSSLTDANLSIKTYKNFNDLPKTISNTYVPARNTIMLAIALGWAEVLNCKNIFIGVSSIDYGNYPDCRPEYIAAFGKMANLATKIGIEGQQINIETPLLNLTKAETVQLGLSLGLDYSLTVSCYQATDEGLACGSCHSCILRKKGFHEAGIEDPTKYLENI